MISTLLKKIIYLETHSKRVTIQKIKNLLLLILLFITHLTYGQTCPTYTIIAPQGNPCTISNVNLSIGGSCTNGSQFFCMKDSVCININLTGGDSMFIDWENGVREIIRTIPFNGNKSYKYGTNPGSCYCPDGSCLQFINVGVWGPLCQIDGVTPAGYGINSLIPYVITLMSNPISEFTSLPNDSVCFYSQPFSFVPNCGCPLAGTTYSWDFGDLTTIGDTSNLFSPSYSYQNPGTYLVTCIASNQCETTTYSMTVYVEAPPDPEIIGNNLFCQGDSTLLTLNAPFDSITWHNNSHSDSIWIKNSINAYVTVYSELGCIGRDTFPVTMEPSPTVAISANPGLSTCIGNSITLTANGSAGSSYIWSNGSPGNSISVTTSGQYAVSATWATNTCEGHDSVIVSFAGNLSPILQSSSPTICGSSSIILSVNGSYTNYSWSGGELTDSITINAPGTYTVTVTDANGCSGTNSITVNSSTGPTPPVVSINANNFCEGSTAQLSVANTANAYLWSTGANTNPITVSTGGTYTVTVTDIDGCTATTDTNVTMLGNPAPVLGSIYSFCQGSSIQVSVTSLPGTTYQWSGGLPSINNPIVTIPGTYTVTVTQSNGCTRLATTYVNELLVTPISFSGTLSVCQGNSTQVFANGYNSYQWSNGTSSNPLVTTSPGTYTVTVTAGNGCTTSASLYVDVFNNPDPVLSLIGPTAPSFCQGDSLLVLLDSTYTTMQWNVSLDTDSSIYVNTGGWIVATVTDTNTCIGKDSVLVTVNSAPPLPLGGTTHLCSPDSALLVAGPAGTYTYQWNNGATNNSLYATSTGLYTVTVTDPTTTCKSSGTENVIVHPKPVCTISTPPKTCQGDTVWLVGNSGVYSYSWSPGTVTNDSLSVWSSGTYQLIIEDINTCRDTENITLTFHQLPAFSIDGDSIICIGDTVPFSSSGSFINYDWATPQGTYSDSSIQVFTDGMYLLTVTDSNYCNATKALSLTNIPLPTPTITGDSTLCAGLGTVLNSGYPNLNNLWSTNDTNNTIYVYQQGNYAVTITDDYGCTGTDQMYVIVNPLPSFSIIANVSGAVCYGDTVSLTTVPGNFLSYLWSDGTTGNSVPAWSSGNYLATVTDGNGCQNTTNYNLVVHPLPVPVPSGPDSSCAGEVEQLSVQTGFLNYLWTPGGSTLNAINVTTSGTYTVHVTDTNYCEADTSINVIFYPVPVVNITGDGTFCTNDSTVLEVNNPNCTYLWTGNFTTPSITVYTGGVYQVTVTNIHGCSSDDVKLIYQYPLPEPYITGDDTICEGFSSNLSTGNYQAYLWTNGSTSNSVNASQTSTWQVTVTDTNNCVNTSPAFNITVLPTEASINANGSLNLCPGQTVTLNANTGLSYQWSNGSTSQSIELDSSATLIVTVTNLNGCVAVSAPVQVNSRPDPVLIVSVIDSLVCNEGYMAYFIDQSVCEPGSLYSWHFGDGDTSSNQSPIHYYQQTGEYDAMLTITSPYGCMKDTTITISSIFNPPAISDFVTNTDIESIIGDSVEFTSLAINAVSTVWIFNDSKNNYSNNTYQVKHAYCDEGDRYPMLIAINMDGCPDTSLKHIHISPFFLENAFTPNRDLLNDGFIIFKKPQNILSYDLKIFSRWAGLIFSTNNPYEFWTGEQNGQIQNEGVYVYTLELTNLAGCPVYTNSAPGYEPKVIPQKSATHIGGVNAIR